MDSQPDAVIVGAGLAGLSCARRLSDAGLVPLLLEADEEIGGRVRTDEIDGFLLDRGFQVFLTAYPEAQALLDYRALDLRAFEPGALIRIGGAFERLSDPWRRPRHALATVLSPAASLPDKLRIAAFRAHTLRGELSDLYGRPARPTIELLRERGFSETVIERFFRPFLGGVFLDRELGTSSRLCEFVFRMFSLGDAALPARGMGEIPKQLARSLPPGAVRTGSRVAALEERRVVLASGESIPAPVVIVATEAPAARQLLGEAQAAIGRGVTCLYFAAPEPPVAEPILLLDGSGSGPINNLCVPSQISPHYAPEGRALVSVTVLDQGDTEEELLDRVRAQLGDWFGPITRQWHHLRSYRIDYALPDQSPPALQPVEQEVRVRAGVFVCGDHRDTGSINGALASGRRAAEAALAALRPG